jgi:hypothetical protein
MQMDLFDLSIQQLILDSISLNTNVILHILQKLSFLCQPDLFPMFGLKMDAQAPLGVQ